MLLKINDRFFKSTVLAISVFAVMYFTSCKFSSAPSANALKTESSDQCLSNLDPVAFSELVTSALDDQLLSSLEKKIGEKDDNNGFNTGNSQSFALVDETAGESDKVSSELEKKINELKQSNSLNTEEARLKKINNEIRQELLAVQREHAAMIRRISEISRITKESSDLNELRTLKVELEELMAKKEKHSQIVTRSRQKYWAALADLNICRQELVKDQYPTVVNKDFYVKDKSIHKILSKLASHESYRDLNWSNHFSEEKYALLGFFHNDMRIKDRVNNAALVVEKSQYRLTVYLTENGLSKDAAVHIKLPVDLTSDTVMVRKLSK